MIDELLGRAPGDAAVAELPAIGLGQQLGLDPIPLSLPDLITRTTHAEEVVR